MKHSLEMVVCGVLFCVAAGGCSWLTHDCKQNVEGFTSFDGMVSQVAPSEYFILRFEYPDGVFPADQWHRWREGQTRWIFAEFRQLKNGTTMLTDGVLNTNVFPVAGVNWHKLVAPLARNVRIKFVGADYSLAAADREETPAGFISLFNGQDLEGWKGVTEEEDFHKPGVRRAAVPEKLRKMQAEADRLMKEHWHVRDGVLFFDGLPGGNSIATQRDYGNLELIADWRLLRVHGDSGFFLRGSPQIQIWDPNMWWGLGSGCIWNNVKAPSAATVCADRPIGDWNRCRMRIIGDKLTVWLNDVKVVDDVTYENCHQPGAPIPLIGQVELQCHGDPVEFRNIFIRELQEEADDIPDPEAAERGERVDLLKDGITGWKAADPLFQSGWSVKDGVLSNFVMTDPTKTSRGGLAGTHLVTKRDDFFDFDLSYDVLVEKECDTGVYLRGRYEIQVNDSYGRKSDCHSMAALYGLIAPTTAAEKPAGEWQHVDLTLYKRHLTVTLNGVKIIDNKPIAGVTPAAMDWDETVPGPIILQGTRSNASFKNMILTKIVK